MFDRALLAVSTAAATFAAAATPAIAAAATATTTAAIATAAATTTTAGRTIFTRTRFIHRQRTSLEVLGMEHLNGFFCVFL